MRNKRKQKKQSAHQKGRQPWNPGKSKNNPVSKPAGEFPYGFHERKTPKTETTALHHCLKADHYDIGFEITWTNLTPAALNPCTESGEPANMPDLQENRKKNYFAGYDKRWLMNKDHLVISPFTVKSAIAGGLANLMGGCYRVITKEEGHPDTITKGNYYYNGGYKRYRVDRSNSKPGIVQSIKVKENGDREIEIQPVTEYYCDNPLNGITLVPGKSYSAKTYVRDHKHFIEGNTLCATAAHQTDDPLIYFGPYRFGMNNGLKVPNLRKKHFHRFYKEKGNSEKALIPAVNFKAASELKKIVYMGKFEPLSQPDPRSGVKIWYQDLTSLDARHWIYFQKLGNTIPAIGKNFQFKTVFAHEDAVPENARLCTDKTRLCPRCRLFGMVELDQDNPGDTAAFKGRFKASALVDASPLTLSDKEISYPVPGTEEKVSLKQWTDKETNNPVARQVLLPISGPPKPNKRDVNGYFKKGNIKGAKIYKHAGLKGADNINAVDRMPADKCKHELRNYAMVCEQKRTFKGTVGAENCSREEIAALFMLLDSSVLNYGYKLGLGKAFGMGTFTSAITKVWVRSSKTYQWKAYDNPDEIRKQFEKEIELLKLIETLKLNNMADMENRNLIYPDPGNAYWRRAWV